MITETESAAGQPATRETPARPRRGPRRWVVTAVAAAMVAVLLASTLAGFRFVQSDPLPVSRAGPVIAVAYDGPWPAARVLGTLRLQDGCLLVDDAVAMFPAGTTWAEPDQVLFADGDAWALGDRIEGGGGHLGERAVTDADLDDRATAAASACAKETGVPDVVLVRPVASRSTTGS